MFKKANTFNLDAMNDQRKSSQSPLNGESMQNSSKNLASEILFDQSLIDMLKTERLKPPPNDRLSKSIYVSREFGHGIIDEED